jgi:hypothetical protein
MADCRGCTVVMAYQAFACVRICSHFSADAVSLPCDVGKYEDGRMRRASARRTSLCMCVVGEGRRARVSRATVMCEDEGGNGRGRPGQ